MPPNFWVSDSTTTTSGTNSGICYTVDSTSDASTNTGLWTGNVSDVVIYTGQSLWGALPSNVLMADPIDRKINLERIWIRSMVARTRRRVQEQAEAVALDLVAELFGSADTDWLVVPSKLHPNRVYHVPIKDKSLYGSMIRVEEKHVFKIPKT